MRGENKMGVEHSDQILRDQITQLEAEIEELLEELQSLTLEIEQLEGDVDHYKAKCMALEEDLEREYRYQNEQYDG